MNVNCWAVIPAAGMGSRMGLGYNKAYMPLDGEPVLRRTISVLMESKLYAGAVVVVRKSERDQVMDMFKGLPWRIEFAPGGDTRQQSVLNGLYALPAECEYVAVHDAARPFVTRNILEKTLESAIKYGSGVACTRVTDTIKRVDDDGSIQTLNRNELRAVQTPQVFLKDMLIKAHEWARTNGISDRRQRACRDEGRERASYGNRGRNAQHKADHAAGSKPRARKPSAHNALRHGI